jgi:hypothetical protein
LSRSLAIRIPLATLLSPLAAAFCVAILLSGWFSVDQLSRGTAQAGKTAEMFFQGIVAFTMLGAIFAGPFTIAFALLTQPPLMWAYGRLGRPSLPLHLLISAALGPPLFLVLFPMMDGGPSGVHPPLTFAGDPIPDHGERLMMPLAIGVTGGGAVGLVWHLLVLSGLSRRKASNG